MKKILPSCYFTNSFAISIILFYSTSVSSQIVRDGTTPTDIKEGNNVTEITGGSKSGSNLFHSFREFSISNGSEAFFNNSIDIGNILTRVTGGNISNINGLIRANGSANLFLINPAGIVFGAGARLDIGGSFYGSSADSIIFPEGEFSAIDSEAQPILTINAPIGLGFRDNPGEIVNQSVANDGGLQVSPGKTIGLIGGDVKLEGGLITAPGGLVELGGLLATGEIGISESGSFNFPEGIARSNVELTNDAAVDVRADGGGFININTKDLLLSDTSELLAGIAENMGSVDAQAGDITVNATDSVTLIGSEVEEDPDAGIEELDTSIRNFVGLPVNRRDNPNEDSSAVGNGGSIFVNTDLLQISNRASIGAKVYGIGNSGDVNLTAQNISVDAGAILSQIRPGGSGNSGNINLDVDSLAVKDLSFIITDNKGGGNAGDININATDSVFVGGEIFNALISELGEGVVGEAGDINIDTRFLTIDGTLGGAQLLTVSKGQGNSGNVNITATDTVSLLGNGDILSQVEPGAEGNGGDISITTKSLDVQGNFTPELDGNFTILANSKGTGNGGSITINATEDILLNNVLINSELSEGVVGEAGDINIDTKFLTLDSIQGGAQLITVSKGQGNAGNVNINATETVSLLGKGDILSQVEPGAEGNGGDISITTKSLDVQGNFTPELDGNFTILANSKGTGNGGSITINATQDILLNNVLINSELSEGVVGEAGDINIDTKFLTLDGTQGDAQLLSNTKGKGNAGNVNITATETVSLLGGGSILSDVEPSAEGRGGDINITAKSLDIQSNSLPELDPNRAIIQASSKGIGNGGNITINTSENILLNNATILSQVLDSGIGNAGTIILNSPLISFDNFSLVGNGITGKGLGGNINITSDSLSIENFSILGANARNNAVGSGGSIDISSKEVKITKGAVISAFTENDSNGGTIAIDANNLEILSGGKIVTQTDGGGNAGNTTLNIADGILIDGLNPSQSGELEPFTDNLLIDLESETGLFANASSNSTGNSGNITIVTPNSLNLVNGAQISVDNRGQGNSGTLTIKASDLSLDNGFISASTVSGFGGLLSLDVDDVLSLDNNSRITAQAFGNADGGNIDIAARFIIATPNQDNDIVANARQGKGGNINISNDGIFGIQERDLSPITNDINVSSDLSIDGSVNISNPDANVAEEAGELPTNVINPDEVLAQTCSASKIAKRVEDALADNESGFTIKSRSLEEQLPTAPLSSDLIKIEGQNFITESESTENSKNISVTEDNRSVSIDDIIPAQGVIVNEKGEIILTSSPTDDNQHIYSQGLANCKEESD